jgi:hypothetical protein
MARALPEFNRQLGVGVMMIGLGVTMRFVLLPMILLGSAALLGINWSGKSPDAGETTTLLSSESDSNSGRDGLKTGLLTLDKETISSSSASGSVSTDMARSGRDGDSSNGDPIATASVMEIRNESNSDGRVHATAKIPTAIQPVSIDHLIQRLKKSLGEIETYSGYTAVLEQQVQKNGRVLDPEMIELKLRRSPFSVYLRWQNDGQEVLYVEGMHDGKLLARPTRGIAALKGIWRLNPKSPHAMKGTRYPLTEIGIEKLNLMALEFYLTNNSVHEGAVCLEVPVVVEGQEAVCYQVTFANEQVSPEYAASHLTFDLKSGLLKSVESYCWGTDSRPGQLLERYRYHRVVPHVGLGDHDFSVSNSEYKFQN